MFRLSRSPAQTINRCLGKHITICYLLWNASFVTILHSCLENYFNEWNIEKEWELLLYFLLSMKIHEGGVFFQWTTFCSQVCIRDFFTAVEVVCLYLQDYFVPLIFLEILCKLTEKSSKYKIKCDKTFEFIGSMNLRTVQSNFPC